ncbi:hypothetical protein F4553_000938 [Allocatelliglobosispora scoriae]|uniref:Uncharacterized protein n=1 Tax=Allocatelliglobosispora scoriae TaxID=643052 RepID=A0A841BK55_9ACTN|nr:OmpH family outer membrane protein [Allocatelliglobosispora scoriae]MBB5867559.1 hypothetical protein [Allocatelliglobosispora scoriae]
MGEIEVRGKELAAYGGTIKKLGTGFGDDVYGEFKGHGDTAKGSDDLISLPRNTTSPNAKYTPDNQNVMHPKTAEARFLEYKDLTETVAQDAYVMYQYLSDSASGLNALGNAAIQSSNIYQGGDVKSKKVVGDVDKMLESWAWTGHTRPTIPADDYLAQTQVKVPPLGVPHQTGYYKRYNPHSGTTPWESFPVDTIFDLLDGLSAAYFTNQATRWHAIADATTRAHAKLEAESTHLGHAWPANSHAKLMYAAETRMAVDSLEAWGKAIEQRSHVLNVLPGVVESMKEWSKEMRTSLNEWRKENYALPQEELDALEKPFKDSAVTTMQSFASLIVFLTPWAGEPQKYPAMLGLPGAEPNPFPPMGPVGGGPGGGPGGGAKPPKIGPNPGNDKNLKAQIAAQAKAIKDLLARLAKERKEAEARLAKLQKEYQAQVDKMRKEAEARIAAMQKQQEAQIAALQASLKAAQSAKNGIAGINPPVMPQAPAVPQAPVVPTVPQVSVPGVPRPGGVSLPSSPGSGSPGGGRGVTLPATPGTGGPGSNALSGREHAARDTDLAGLGAGQGQNTLLGRDGLAATPLGAADANQADAANSMPMIPPMMPPGGTGGGAGGGGRPRTVRRPGGPKLVLDADEASKALSGRGRDERPKPKIVALETESWTNDAQVEEPETEGTQRGTYGVGN